MAHTFCRMLLAATMKDVKRIVPSEIRKEAWTHNYGDGRCEFQIPSKKFYWYGQAHCAWHARQLGWCQYLSENHQEEYE